MSLICTDVITPAFERTKKFMFPFKLKPWLKLGFLSLLASSLWTNFNFNYRFSSPSDFVWFVGLWESYPGLIITGAIFLVLLGLFLVFISSLLTFTLFKSVDTQKVLIKKNTKDTFGLGKSYFWFNLIAGFVIALVFILLILLFVWPFITGQVADFPLASILLLILVFGLIVFILALFFAFIKLFVIYYMYLKKKRFCFSFRKSWGLLKKHFTEMFVFALIRLGMQIAIAIAAFFLMLILLIPILIVGAILGGIVYLVYQGLGLVVAIVLGVIFGLIILIAFALVVLLIAAPIDVFLINYNLMFMRKILALKN